MGRAATNTVCCRNCGTRNRNFQERWWANWAIRGADALRPSDHYGDIYPARVTGSFWPLCIVAGWRRPSRVGVHDNPSASWLPESELGVSIAPAPPPSACSRLHQLLDRLALLVGRQVCTLPRAPGSLSITRSIASIWRSISSPTQCPTIRAMSASSSAFWNCRAAQIVKAAAMMNFRRRRTAESIPAAELGRTAWRLSRDPEGAGSCHEREPMGCALSQR